MDLYRIAPDGKFRIVTADGMGSFTYVEKDYDTYEEALDHVTERCKTGYFWAMWIYNDQGTELIRATPD